MKTVDEYRELLRWMLKTAQNDVKSARERIASDGDFAHALEWSASAFYAAASEAVLERAVKIAESVDTLEAMDRRLLEEALRKARWPVRSTSVPANFIGQEIAAAWASLVAEVTERRRERGT